VAVVSESFARRFWPGEDPIGKTFRVGNLDPDPFLGPRTVVGVVGDIRVRGRERQSEPQLYLPARQVANGALINYDPKDLVIRFAGEPSALVAGVRRIVQSVDPEQPISTARCWRRTRRAQLRVLGALAVMALLLAGVGVHGLLAYTVSLRSREIGVRLALGAAPAGVAAMVLRDGMRLAALGIVPGLLAAVAAGRGMRALLFGVQPADPLTLGAVLAVVLLTALLGSLLPALLAVRVSPATVLHSE
jgi:predicted lysophospholipase L1 biosynthesis ABC-type transport system permease subunit